MLNLFMLVLFVALGASLTGCVPAGPQLLIQREENTVGQTKRPIRQRLSQNRGTGSGAVYSSSPHFRNFGGTDPASGVQSKSESFSMEGSGVSLGQWRTEGVQ